jgi:hypothetical protein
LRCDESGGKPPHSKWTLARGNLCTGQTGRYKFNGNVV